MLQVQELNVMFNPNKHSVLFVGHRQTGHIPLRRRRTGRLIRTRRLISVSTVCLQNVLLEFDEKMKNNTQLPLKRKWTGPIDNGGKIHSA